MITMLYCVSLSTLQLTVAHQRDLCIFDDVTHFTVREHLRFTYIP